MDTALTAAERAAITAVILAGGAGSRFGFQDKAWLTWQGRPFIARLIEGLQPQVGSIAINSSDAERFRALALPVIADPFPGRCGPLAGMLAGLEYSRTPLVLITPCDTPRVSPLLAPRLYHSLQKEDAAIAYATTNGDHHYLFALLRRELAGDLRHYLANGGRAVRHWYAGHRCCRVAFDDQAVNFINVNTAEELAALAAPQPAP